VRLCGDDGHGCDRLLDIASPSSLTVLPFRHEGHVRFSSSNFTLAGTLAEADQEMVTESSSLDLTLRWTAARDVALAVDVEDELPEPPSLLSMMSVNGKGKLRGKAKEKGQGQEISPNKPSPSRPGKPPAPFDEEIKVGEEDGELVLARDHKDRPDHWPARVVGAYQDKKTRKWLYEVCYIDGKKKKMDRSRFFSSEQEGFATCQVRIRRNLCVMRTHIDLSTQLGQWLTEWPVSDTEGPDSEDDFRARNDARSSSPSPSDCDLPAVADSEKFCARPLAEQMRYVYPFLCRIIRREYGPSYERHDAFMKGGKARQELGQTASMRGDFSENEVKKVSALVRKTMLRNERWAERVYYGNEVRDEESRKAQPDWSDETKAESVAESVFVSFMLDFPSTPLEIRI
jgi:hypothetical protein